MPARKPSAQTKTARKPRTLTPLPVAAKVREVGEAQHRVDARRAARIAAQDTEAANDRARRRTRATPAPVAARPDVTTDTLPVAVDDGLRDLRYLVADLRDAMKDATRRLPAGRGAYASGTSLAQRVDAALRGATLGEMPVVIDSVGELVDQLADAIEAAIVDATEARDALHAHFGITLTKHGLLRKR